MASVHLALSAPELALLAGPDAASWHLSVVNSTDTATALINQASFTYPLAVLTVDTVSGNWSSVSPGNSVAVGGHYIGRVRKVGDATHIFLGETSEGDPGLITQSIRNASFVDNQAITVYLKRRDIWSVIPRIIAASGTIYEDYDTAVGSSNATPENIPIITMNSTDRRAGFVDAGQTYRTVQFDATEDLWPVASSVASRLWTAPASWGAPTAGSTTSASVTYQVPRSAENYEIQYQFTDNNGVVTTAYRQVWSHDRTGSTAPLTISEITNIGWNESGIQLTILMNDTALASIPVGAMVVVWCDPAIWNGSGIDSAITQFVGWVVRQSETSEPGLASATLEIAGPEGMLSRRGAYSQWFDQAASPTTWQQLPSTLEYVDFLTWWCAWKRARGITECFNWIKDGHSNLTARLPQWRVEAAGNLLSQMRRIAEGYRRANVGCNPDGTVVVKPKINYIDYSQRGSLATRCTLTEARRHDVELVKDPIPRVRRTRGEGFYWDGATAQPTPMLSDAPGDAPGQGTADETLQSQTVDNQTFLNTVTGLAHADSNNPYPDGTVKIEGFWPVFYPAERQYVALSIPAANRPDGVALNMNVHVKSVSLRKVDDGMWDTLLSIEGETSGVAGVTVPVPTQAASNPPYVPAVTPNPLPASAISGSHGGGSVLVLGNGTIGYSNNFGDASPSWANLNGTGMSGTVVDIMLDPFSDFLGAPQTGNLGAWALTTNGLYYTSNILQATPVWVLKNSLSPSPTGGVLRPSGTSQGTIYVAWCNDGGFFNSLTYVAKLTNYGTTSAWSQSLGSANNGGTGVGFDIDSYGSDEVLVHARDGGANNSRVYRILSGGAAVSLVSLTFANNQIGFIQKPLQKFGGGSNSDTGSGEHFVYCNSGNGTPKLWKTTNGGSSSTDITPPSFADLNNFISSIVAGDDSNYIAVSDMAGRLCTSVDGGTSWTDHGTDVAGRGFTIGYFPRLLAGQYVLYMGGTSKITVSTDFGSTSQDKTGSWSTDIGTPSNFYAVIPLY